MNGKRITMKKCEFCEKDAMYKLTFLLPNARMNRSSSAYGKDDCSYCEDAARFVCQYHYHKRNLQSYEWCASFQDGEWFHHLFLDKDAI